jgi:hypothetical protein
MSGVTGFFNLAQGAVRIVAVASPTDPACAAGLDSVAALITRNPSRRLRAYLIFVRAVESDTRMTALERTADFADRRVVVFWNDNGSLPEVFGALTSTGGKVHNGYFLYDTAATFETRHATPAELAIYPGSAATIESGVLATRAEALLEAFEQMRREAQKPTE